MEKENNYEQLEELLIAEIDQAIEQGYLLPEEKWEAIAELRQAYMERYYD